MRERRFGLCLLTVALWFAALSVTLSEAKGLVLAMDEMLRSAQHDSVAQSGGAAPSSGGSPRPSAPQPGTSGLWPMSDPAAPRPADSSLPADLSVLYISRAPRYPRYDVRYDTGVPLLAAGTENLKRFPDPGQIVTFTAVIANQGDTASAPTDYVWEIDGKLWGDGTLTALSPTGQIALKLTWPWQSGAHTVTLQVAVTGAEVTAANNRLDQRTDAHDLELRVHPYFARAFADYRNLVGSYSFADWIQAQVAMLNQRLAQAVYPLTPQGLPDRVRLDIITVTTQLDDAYFRDDFSYDGRWVYRPEQDDHHTPEDEAWLSVERYARDYATGIDWGLIHELAHQLGVIDLYWLNIPPSAGNRVLDAEGLPLLSGFYYPRADLMGGDDRGTYDGTYFGAHTAGGLLSNSGQRRGYFGEYLYDLPSEVRVQALDARGQPLPGAQIEAYQSVHTIIPDLPAISGSTDARGVFVLPNRPVSPTVTTATGHTLRANPFGQISVIGMNAQMLLRAGWQDQEYYAWLPLPELNKAAWRGEQVYTVTLATHFPADATILSPRPTVRTAGEAARLEWAPVAGAASYNIYRGVWPDYYPFQQIAAGITETTYTAALTQTARFAVTAVSADGRESGFSPIQRAERLYAPRGLVWRSDGQLGIVDGHLGAMLLALPPNERANQPLRWIGRVGSEHYNLVGATAATAAPGSLIGVSLREQRRIWLLDEQTRLVNWFGRIEPYADDLGYLSALLVGGEAFTISLPITQEDAATLLALPFADGLTDLRGQSPAIAEGVTTAPGRFGSGVGLTEGSRLIYNLPAFDDVSGSVEFWLRGDRPGNAIQEQVLLEISNAEYLLQIGQVQDGVYVWATDFVSHEFSAWGDSWSWQAGEWHHLAATWEGHRLSLYLDGRLAGDATMHHPITTTLPVSLALGATVGGEYRAEAVFDELRLSQGMRLGNSGRARVIVGQEMPPELRVYDLLGNLLSRYVSGGESLYLSASALAGDAEGGAFWLADETGGKVHRFRLTGDTLSWERSLALDWERGPHALAVHESGLLAVGDGDRVLIYDPVRARLMHEWRAPNDGATDEFRSIVALAFSPDGDDLAVLEDGSDRASLILGALHPVRWYLPGIAVSNR